MDAIRLLRKELEGRVPLIGFAGAPFTTGTYMIEGGTSKNFLNTKMMIYQDPALYKSFMDKVTATITEYLKAQIAAGAQAVQIFDTWGGIFGPADFREHALSYVQKIIRDLKEWMSDRGESVPVIYFVGSTAGLLEDIKTSGADVYGVDWRIDLDTAIKRLGGDVVVQGNLDPLSLFLPKDKIEERVQDVLHKGSSSRGHIFNLGHGVVPQTQPENVIALVEMGSGANRLLLQCKYAVQPGQRLFYGRSQLFADLRLHVFWLPAKRPPGRPLAPGSRPDPAPEWWRRTHDLLLITEHTK